MISISLYDQSHCVFYIQKPIPSVLSRDKNKPEDPGKKKNEQIFPWVNGFSKAKHIHECRRNIWTFRVQKKYMDISTKIHWHRDGKYPQGRENQNVIEERKCWFAWNTMQLRVFKKNKHNMERSHGNKMRRWSIIGVSKYVAWRREFLLFLAVLRVITKKGIELVKLKKNPFENWSESIIM